MGARMSILMRRFAVGLVRLWCRMYTWDVSPQLAASRRAEIESDLWELQHDPEPESGASAGWRIVGRLLMGVADDVAWRMETAMDGDDPLVRRAVAFAAAATILLVALWTLPTWSGSQSVRRTPVTDCADGTTPSQMTRDLRIRLMQCAGAFFTPRAKSAPGHVGP
jgi:hypothetical protein